MTVSPPGLSGRTQVISHLCTQMGHFPLCKVGLMEMQRTGRALPLRSRVTSGPSGHFRLTWSSPQQRAELPHLERALSDGARAEEPAEEAVAGAGAGPGGATDGTARAGRVQTAAAAQGWRGSSSQGRSGDGGPARAGRGRETPGTGEGDRERERRRSSRRGNGSVVSLLLLPPQRRDRLSLCSFFRLSVCSFAPRGPGAALAALLPRHGSKGDEALTQVPQRSGGSSIPGTVQGQVGCGFEQSGDRKSVV